MSYGTLNKNLADIKFTLEIIMNECEELVNNDKSPAQIDFENLQIQYRLFHSLHRRRLYELFLLIEKEFESLHAENASRE